MPRTPRFIVSVVLMLLANSPLCAADASTALRLIGTVDGQDLDQFTAENGELRVRDPDGSTRAVPRGVRWRLEGDLRANAEAINFAPEYRIVTKPAVPMHSTRRTSTHAIIFVRPAKGWTKAQLTGGVVVFCWLVDGRPVWVAPVVAETRPGPSSDFAAVAALELDPATRRGVPVVYLLRAGVAMAPSPHFRNREGNEALAAMVLGRAEELDRLAAASDLGKLVGGGATLLHRAAEGGFTDAVRRLLGAGARPNKRTGDENTALHLAAMNGRTECVTALLAGGADRLAGYGFYGVPPDAALACGHMDTAYVLLGEKPSRERLMATLDLAASLHDDHHLGLLNDALTHRLGAKFTPVVAESLDANGETEQIYAESEATLPPLLRNAPKPLAVNRQQHDIHTVSEREIVTRIDQRGQPHLEQVRTYDVQGSYDHVAVTNHWAVVSLVVEADGRPTRPQIVSSASTAVGRAMLDAVETYEFLPGEVAGQPVAMRTTLVITIPH